MDSSNGRVRALPLALAIGIVWGLGMLGVAIAAMYIADYGQKAVEVMASVYPGYGATWGGAFWGLLWGFVDAFIGTLIILGIYCLLARCCRRGNSAPASAPPVGQ